MNPRFVRIVYRARNVGAARAFYTALLGDPEIEVVPLPAAAAARGVPPHWLGAIGVDDVAQTLAQFVARGATPLGPVVNDAGGAFATLRDAGGALIALTTAQPPAPLRPTVVWSHLDARDAQATFGGYAALFGWRSTEPIDLGPSGTMMQFAWEAAGPNGGSYADLAARPSHHPQWVFQFRVGSLDAALEAVRSGGGVVLQATTLPGGSRVVVCDDPDTGGFALRSDPNVTS